MRPCRNPVRPHFCMQHASVASNITRIHLPKSLTVQSKSDIISNPTSQILNLWLTRQISTKKYKRESAFADKLEEFRKNEQIKQLYTAIEQLQQIWEIPEPQKPMEHQMNIYIDHKSLDFYQKAFDVAQELNIPESNVFVRSNNKVIPWHISLEKFQQSLLDEIRRVSNSKIDPQLPADYEQALKESQQLEQHNKELKTEFSLFISPTRDRVPSLFIQQRGTPGRVCVSFHDVFANYSRKSGKSGSIPMIRALRSGVGKPLSQTTIIDANGGFGIDAFKLCCVGCQVTVCEKNPIVFRLLKDGYERGMQTKQIREVLERMRILNVDSKEHMMSLSEEEKPDAIFLDPIYPSKRKMKSQFGKEMQIIGQLVEKIPADRPSQLISIAQQSAKKCVILKRPYYIPVDPNCNRSYKSRSEHFDVFLTKRPTNVVQ